MTDSKPTTLERRGPVAVITLNSPETRNALGEAVAAGLHAALVDVAPDPQVRAVVLTGAGGAFSAGADLKEGLPETQRVEDMINSRYRPSLELITGMDKPVIAAIPGAAAGMTTRQVVSNFVAPKARDPSRTMRGTAASPSSVATITTGTVSSASVKLAQRMPPVLNVGVGSISG